MINNILLIDDNEMDNFIAQRLLIKNNVTQNVMIKSSGEEALSYLDELKNTSQPFPDIILLDINMPVMDGFEFLKIYSHYPHKLIDKSCVIVLSSSSDQKDIHKAKRFRLVKDYFIKPFTSDKVEKLSKHYSALCNQ
jgi:CheY-like chemotaxis protein